jgi:DNA-binding NarL/FixJ family response regulator
MRICTPLVCVIDDATPGSAACRELAAARSADLRTLPGAGDALRFSRTERVDLWIISADLPNRAGFELCSMLRQQQPQAAIMLVSDHVTPELEQAAWAARPTMFGCRAEQEIWLRHWLDRLQRPSTTPVNSQSFS